jgi:hypothetical protein
MKHLRIIVAVLFFGMAFSQSCTMKTKADLIGINGVIYTVDSAFSIAEAFAVKDGKFLFVGTTEEVKDNYTSDNVIDFKGGAVYPGLIDAHCHLLELGVDLMSADLKGSKSLEEVVGRVKDFHAKHPGIKILTGAGWDQNLWENKNLPDNKLLNREFPDIPVCLVRIDGHAVLANEAAIKALGLDVNDKKLDKGECKISGGKFTGIFMENMCVRFRTDLSPVNKDSLDAALMEAQKECFRYGLTSVCDAEEEYGTLQTLLRMDSEGSLKLRVDAWPLPTEENFEKVTSPFTQGRVKVDTYKLYRDGALGSRGSLLKEDYSDMPGWKGLDFYAYDRFKGYCQWCYEHGFRVATHCIGDAAVASALDVYSEFLKGPNDLGWRIEHAQIVADEDLDRFRQYSVIPSVQPTHCTSDMFWAKERLGDRIRTGYRYKELLAQLGWLPSGTDFPIEHVTPIYTFFAAVFRKNLEFKPEEGFQMENALTKEEALRSMTIWAARSTNEEASKGSIEAGKVADFVTTDIDFFTADEKKVPETVVTGTWINGEKVFSL